MRRVSLGVARGDPIQYCKSVRAEAAAAQSELRKATANATSLAAARAVADEKARKKARARGGRSPGPA